MKKTSVYLSDADSARLARLAERRHMSRAQVLREALAMYDGAVPAERRFALEGAFEGDGRSFAEYTEEEIERLLDGFGE
jgi:predicted transcriptional regulator